MKLYSDNKNYKLYQGSMLDMSEVIESNTIDSIVTDPPYELNFMGKGWDNAGVSFQTDTWKKCFEVLKPGGYLLAFGGSRTFHRIACAIEDAGFEIRDTIMWLYGSGFPKSMDISKQIDKLDGKSTGRGKRLKFTKWLSDTGITAKEINEVTNSNMASHYLTQNEQPAIPTRDMFEKIRPLLKIEVPKFIEKLIDERTTESENFKNRQVIGKMNNPASSIYSMGEKKMNRDVNITTANTPLAKQWQGWGTCLKPAFEPIIVARKPFKGSLVDNVMTNGVGGLNIDEYRVGDEERENPQAGYIRRGRTDEEVFMGVDKNKPSGSLIVNGRFPANIILDDTFTEEWSRYFYCAKASKKDRDEDLMSLRKKHLGN